LADVFAVVSADPALSSSRRANYRCALRCLARLLGKELALIPTAPDALRPLLLSVAPAAHGMSDARWRGIRSHVIGSLKPAGVPVMPGRSTSSLSFDWATLERALPNQHTRFGLSRFMRFCAERAIEPEAVDQSVFDRFREVLLSESVVKAPRQVHRVACHLWNKAARTISGWPPVTVTVPRNTRHYALPWSAFPESFVRDVDAFLGRSCSCGPFTDDYGAPQRPGTIRLQRMQIQQMASHLVQTGVAIETITSLSTLSAPATAKRILLAAHKRAGNQSPHLHGMAVLLKVIAKQWIKAPTEEIRLLAGYAAQAAPRKRGMTDKNHARLRQFDDPGNVRALLDLPRKVYRQLKQVREIDEPAATRALRALAVEFLVTMPMRVGNLVALDFDRHIVATGSGRKRVLHVVIPGSETKTGEPYEVPIPAETAALLEVYRTRVRPVIASTPNSLVFPNARGEKRSEIPFSSALTRFVRNEIGLTVNAHLFRHLAVTLYLREQPEDVETARRILGHKSLTTTLRFYAEIKAEAAFRRYDAVIGSLRPQPPGRGGR